MFTFNYKILAPSICRLLLFLSKVESLNQREPKYFSMGSIDLTVSYTAIVRTLFIRPVTRA